MGVRAGGGGALGGPRTSEPALVRVRVGVDVVEDDVPSRLGGDGDEKPGDDPGNAEEEGEVAARGEALGWGWGVSGGLAQVGAGGKRWEAFVSVVHVQPTRERQSLRARERAHVESPEISPVRRMIANVTKLTICSAREAAAETISPARKLRQVSASDRVRSRAVLSGGIWASAASAAAAGGAAGAGASAAGFSEVESEDWSPAAALRANWAPRLVGSRCPLGAPRRSR